MKATSKDFWAATQKHFARNVTRGQYTLYADRFNQYCNATGLTKTAVFESMIDQYCKLESFTGGLASMPDLFVEEMNWVGKDRSHLLAHLYSCFADHGGALKKEGCFYTNDS